MTTQTLMPIPPRPAWMRPRPADAPATLPPEQSTEANLPVIAREEPIPLEVTQRRVLRRAGNASTGALVSAAIHLAILLLLNLWYFAIRPGSSGYVINCQIMTEDDGAQAEENAVVQAPLPDEPPPAEDIPAAVPLGGGAEKKPVARIGGGAGDGDGAGGGGVGFFGTKAEGNSFVFVVDRSGSMDDGRLTAAKRELNRAIGSLRPDQRFYVLFYHSRMERMLAPTAPSGLVFATPEVRDDVRAWIRPVLASGGTEPKEALLTALEMRPDVIFFLTDGQIPDESDAVVRANNFHGTIVHTTALVSKKGESILQQIANDNGGTYRHIAAVPADPGSPVQADNTGSGRKVLVESLEARKTRQRLEKQRRAADAKLRLARKFLREGHPLSGRRWLEKIIQEYPGTNQANQAQQLLLEL